MNDLEKLIEFLCEQNCYEAVVEILKEKRRPPYNPIIDARAFLGVAFIWTSTPQGSDYWRIMSSNLKKSTAFDGQSRYNIEEIVEYLINSSSDDLLSITYRSLNE